MPSDYARQIADAGLTGTLWHYVALDAGRLRAGVRVDVGTRGLLRLRDEPVFVTTVPPEAERLLESEPLMAHLGTCVDGRPHVAPVWYRYADDVVELVTTGRKLQNVRDNPKVALSIQADDGGHAKWMVTLLGTATVVESEAETDAARQRINAKYGADADAYEENALVRIDVGSATYRTY